MLQLNLAGEWKKRLSQQLGSEGEAVEERVFELLTYINHLKIPKRSPTYDDLHTRAA